MANKHDSVAGWVDGLRAGDSQCAYHLHREVYERLVRYAERRLNGFQLRWADQDDVALSAFKSFCTRVVDGRLTQVKSRGELWSILARIASRKAIDYVRRDRRQKRGGGGVRGDSVFGVPDDSVVVNRQATAGDQAIPDLALILAEESQRLLDSLGNETLAQVAVWKLEGYTNAEIATRLGCVERTVERKVERIREKWSKRMRK